MSRTPVPTTSDAQVGASHARLVRGVAAGALATFVALFSHVAAGGHAPVLPGVVLPLVLAVFVSVVLAGQRLSLLRLSASVAVSQSAFHWIFSAAAASSPGAGRASAARATADAVAAGDPTRSTTVPVSPLTSPRPWARVRQVRLDPQEPPMWQAQPVGMHCTPPVTTARSCWSHTSSPPS